MRNELMSLVGLRKTWLLLRLKPLRNWDEKTLKYDVLVNHGAGVAHLSRYVDVFRYINEEVWFSQVQSASIRDSSVGRI